MIAFATPIAFRLGMGILQDLQLDRRRVRVDWKVQSLQREDTSQEFPHDSTTALAAIAEAAPTSRLTSGFRTGDRGIRIKI